MESLGERDSNIQRLGSQLAKSEVHIQELQRYPALVMSYENKFALISQQAIRLTDLLRHKN